MSESTFVHEAEAYRLLRRAGLHPPRHGVVGSSLPFVAGEPVVVKGLGEEVWHKSELGAVRFLPFDGPGVSQAVAAMRQQVEADGHRWIDGLVCEKIEIAGNAGLPGEAFLSLTRGEAGWTALFGFGGMQAEALAELAPPLRWPLAYTTSGQALRELEAHLLGRIWLGTVRGTKPLTTRPILQEFLGAVWRLAGLAEDFGITLLELNPVALDPAGLLRPLDAVGRRGPGPAPRLAPPAGFLPALRAPRRLALAGVSATPGGVGRTILENLERYQLPDRAMVLIKPGQAELLGHPCVPDVSALRANPVDLLILALPAPVAFRVLGQLIEQGGGAAAVALTCGGIGDGADTAGFGTQLTRALCVARAGGYWTPAVLGPNFLGHWVPEWQLDTSFIPAEKLAAPAPAGGPLTLLSQSGAFLLSRRSRQPALRFGLGLSLGNQLDVAVCDVLAALAGEPKGGPVACYVEGYGPGQLGVAAAAIRQLHALGRTVLIHRAGRTAAGQAAAASHTGALASDLALEQELLTRAGARFADSVADLDHALTWLSAYPRFQPGPIALLTNAGFESVNAGDRFDDRLPAAELNEAAQQALRSLLQKHELADLVNPRLPLDLTPMADANAFLDAADLLLAQAAVLVVGLVPFTRRLNTSPAGAAVFAAALARIGQVQGKPVAIVVDTGADYADFRQAFTRVGLPVFDRIESALAGLRVLG